MALWRSINLVLLFIIIIIIIIIITFFEASRGSENA